jgi:hypothetical protein
MPVTKANFSRSVEVRRTGRGGPPEEPTWQGCRGSATARSAVRGWGRRKVSNRQWWVGNFWGQKLVGGLLSICTRVKADFGWKLLWLLSTTWLAFGQKKKNVKVQSKTLLNLGNANMLRIAHTCCSLHYTGVLTEKKLKMCFIHPLIRCSVMYHQGAYYPIFSMQISLTKKNNGTLLYASRTLSNVYVYTLYFVYDQTKNAEDARDAVVHGVLVVPQCCCSCRLSRVVVLVKLKFRHQHPIFRFAVFVDDWIAVRNKCTGTGLDEVPRPINY